VAVSGQCFVQTEGKRIPLKAGEPVRVADVVDVPAGAKLKLRMNDGSVLSVASGSQLMIAVYNVDADGKRHNVELSLGQGLLHAIVAPADRPTTFEVNTAVGSAGVRSTDWFIEAEPGSMLVGVLSGSVTLTSKATGAEVLIPAGSGHARLRRGPYDAACVWRKAEFNALIARTELPAPAAPRRPAQQPRQREPSEQEYTPPPAPAPQPQYNPGQYNPGQYNPPYNPGGGGYGPAPSRGYPDGAYEPPGSSYSYRPPMSIAPTHSPLASSPRAVAVLRGTIRQATPVDATDCRFRAKTFLEAGCGRPIVPSTRGFLRCPLRLRKECSDYW
jgi:hypothetical protein